MNNSIQSKESSSNLTSNSLSNSKNGISYNEWKDKRRELYEEMHSVEEKSLQSTKETLGLIIESEKIGIKTGKELVRQRETLNGVEDKLVTINEHLNESQQHINSMKSIFSSFKSYFSKKSKNSVKSSENNLFEEKNNFEHNLETNNSFEGHINNKRKVNSIQSNDEFDGNESTFLAKNSNQTINYWQKSNEINDKIEQNLNEIDFGVEKLKQLSLNLGQEIDSQNCLIDRIIKETNGAEITIEDQNNQLRKLLKK